MSKQEAKSHGEYRLSAVQAKVMTYLSQRWSARVAHGSAVHINGARVCNVDTMSALERLGLVERAPGTGEWTATPAGRR